MFSLQASLNPEARRVLDALQNLIVEKVTLSTTVQHLEFKGQKIITELFETFATDPKRLLPPREVTRWEAAAGEAASQYRVICDYIAGMTDEYATKRYQQLFEPRVGSVFDRL